jgi:hypothetical protein
MVRDLTSGLGLRWPDRGQLFFLLFFAFCLFFDLFFASTAGSPRHLAFPRRRLAFHRPPDRGQCLFFEFFVFFASAARRPSRRRHV